MKESATVLAALFVLGGCRAPPEHRGKQLESRATDSILDSQWPVPADSVLLEQMRKALDLRLRDDFDRFLDAREPGELLEHATLTQADGPKRAGVCRDIDIPPLLGISDHFPRPPRIVARAEAWVVGQFRATT